MSVGVSSASPLRFGLIAGRLPFPRHSLSLIVKGTFDLLPDGEATLAEEQLALTGDELYPGDEDMQGAPRYESDFAYFKPHADLLLVGRCHAPNGQPTPECPVTFRVGAREKTLTVSGDRRWERSGLGWRATDAEPFTEMELRYERSIGSPDSPTNPIGKGARVIEDEHGNKYRPHPNIEDPASVAESPRSRPPPAGFGPLGRSWEPRRSLMGSFDESYVKTRWPWFPEDFDWGHFNAAPAGMQSEEYLRGDEDLYFENLHPRHAQYRSRLPGRRVRCFVNRRAEDASDRTDFVEIPMALDTLWVDMEAEKLVLVWRGWTEVKSEDYEEIRDLFIMAEPLADPPASLNQCRQQFIALRAAEEKAEAPEGPGEQLETGDEAAVAPDEPGPDRAHLEAQSNALLAQLGIDVGRLPPEFTEKRARLFERFDQTDPAKAAEMQLEEVDAQMRQALAKFDLDPDRLPPLTAKAKAEQLRFMKELGMNPADVGADPEFGKYWALTAAVMPRMGLDPENLGPLIDSAKKQQQRMKQVLGIEDEEEAEAGAPTSTRETVAARAARGESFVGENLSGLDLSGLDLAGLDCSQAVLAGAALTDANLQGTILAGANLTGANLTGVDLTGANLAGADLSEATLDKASLADADLAKANLTGASLREAVITDAVFEKAVMPGALLDGVRAKDVNFSGADLTGAGLEDAVCPGADFSNATLDHANCQRAQLSEASMQGARARQINLESSNLAGLRASGGADFTGGMFWRVRGRESIWDEADLTECDFRGCKMENATFASACLRKADLSATDMRFSRFTKADLSDAKMIYMNLFQGSLEKANLTDANLSRSNMYEVEFLDAVVERTQLIGANLHRTKLEQQ